MKLNPSEELCWGTLGTVRPFPDFHPERDVAVIQAALDKKDINTLVRILTNRSNAQRQVLAQIYQNLTKKDLKAGLKKVLSGDLEALMLGLMMTPYQFEAHRLRQAMEGVGTDEEPLLEILCTRTPQQLSSINAVYNKEYKCDLEKDLISETSGDFTKLLVALLKQTKALTLKSRDFWFNSQSCSLPSAARVPREHNWPCNHWVSIVDGTLSPHHS
uniref:Zgc:101785 n=1 Tax=Astyanax mexicanus TaxID=7994 RepID=A0A8B9JPJ1_ASTMX